MDSSPRNAVNRNNGPLHLKHISADTYIFLAANDRLVPAIEYRDGRVSGPHRTLNAFDVDPQGRLVCWDSVGEMWTHLHALSPESEAAVMKIATAIKSKQLSSVPAIMQAVREAGLVDEF